MSLQEAGDAPRINHRGSSQSTREEMNDGGTIYLESGFSSETIRALSFPRHKLSQSSFLGFGGYQAIMLKNGVYYGASEPRKDGQAAGY